MNTLFWMCLILANLIYAHHYCNEEIVKTKNYISKIIDQSLYKYYDLQAQAKTNIRNVNKVAARIDPNVVKVCFVEDKLRDLYRLIQHFFAQHFEQAEAHFNELSYEIEQNNLECIETIKNLC